MTGCTFPTLLKVAADFPTLLKVAANCPTLLKMAAASQFTGAVLSVAYCFKSVAYCFKVGQV